MSKSVEGWYDKPPEDFHDKKLNCLMRAISSHGGWYCPHCEHKEDFSDLDTLEGLGSENVIQLYTEGYEPKKFRCEECDRDYFIKSHVAIKFESCKDTLFED